MMTDTTRTTGKLRRPLDNRVIAGVCAGLGRHFDFVGLARTAV